MKKKKKERKKEIELICHICDKSLPLLHPHIMIERNDNKGNIICEECYQLHFVNRERY